MPVYVYRGTNRTGGSVTGEQSATNKAELINLLRRQQIKVSKLSEKGKEFSLPTFKAGVNAKDLAVFTRQFSVMIDAGLPLVQCLEILAGQQENKTFESVLTTTRGCPRCRRGRHHSFAVEGCADFCHVVPGTGRCPTPAYAHCDGAE
jgi:type IV pilus assembly protein PilC